MTLKRLDDSGKLVDVTPLEREHYDTGTDLVPVDMAECPMCSHLLDQGAVWQDALFRHGGYGGTQRVVTQSCAHCLFERVVAVATERPPR